MDGKRQKRCMCSFGGARGASAGVPGERTPVIKELNRHQGREGRRASSAEAAASWQEEEPGGTSGAGAFHALQLKSEVTAEPGSCFRRGVVSTAPELHRTARRGLRPPG
ncbi:hypothetical protein NDU88_004076 [Pleurodeles waltl]|uniref:Uncharacterized protein n=1 Tax=Pleurodeles waltl TaxID=8319 RepID=A0AAV7V3D5_PLEWA|nr:hypothetical protein NDU88_004076 [Pleurodeles waltl]